MLLDSATQERLRQRYNPDGSELRALQMRMLEMLKWLDELCTSHGIIYWLSSGTALGAVRHGGFIPWDDDVDVEMSADQYARLTGILKGDNSPLDGTQYCWQDEETDADYLLAFGKLRDSSGMVSRESTDRYYNIKGAWIDVFVLDPSNTSIWHRVLRFRKDPRIIATDPSWLRRRLILPLHGAIQRLLLPVARRLGRIGAGERLRHRLPSFFTRPRMLSEILPVRRIPFEGIMLPVAKDTDSYLRRIFGDYNRLPDNPVASSHSVAKVTQTADNPSSRPQTDVLP